MPAIKFIVDNTLGTVAKWLRILGYDTVYCRSPRVDDLLQQARLEEREVLTRNSHLKIDSAMSERVCVIRAQQPLLQLREVIDHYQLDLGRPFHLTRCIRCNRLLKTAPASLLVSRVPEYVRSTCKKFFWCVDCNKVYWRGSHYHNMQERIKQKLMHWQ